MKNKVKSLETDLNHSIEERKILEGQLAELEDGFEKVFKEKADKEETICSLNAEINSLIPTGQLVHGRMKQIFVLRHSFPKYCTVF